MILKYFESTVLSLDGLPGTISLRFAPEEVETLQEIDRNRSGTDETEFLNLNVPIGDVPLVGANAQPNEIMLRNYSNDSLKEDTVIHK